MGRSKEFLKNAARRLLVGGLRGEGNNPGHSTDRDDNAIGDRWHYHTIRGKDGVPLWRGQYDLYSLWPDFGIPDDLSGVSVLDIGMATGFFAFECEKRGAKPVMGTEIPDISDWDTRGGGAYRIVNIPRENQRDFLEAKARIGSEVQVHFGSINEALHETIGVFDWVIFGALLTHLRDPMLALSNVRALTGHRAVVISSFTTKLNSNGLMWVHGRRPIDWWLPSKSLIPNMLEAAGFSRVKQTGEFVLQHANGMQQTQACWHAFP